MGTVRKLLKRVLPAALAAYAVFAVRGALAAAVEQPDSPELTGVYLVLVNASNRYSGERAEAIALLRDLYLRNAETWPDGEPSLPLGRPATSPASQALARFVLDMDPSELDGHWRRLQDSSDQAPPEVVEQPRDLLLSIARNEGAFSVIAEGEVEKLPAKVRVLFTLSAPPVRPAMPPIAGLEQFLEDNTGTVRRALTAFNRKSGDAQVRSGQAQLIHGFEVLGTSADRFLIALTYSWRFLNNDRIRTDYLLVRLADGDLRIVERVAGPEAVALTPPPGSAAGLQPAALTTFGGFDGRWQAHFECESRRSWTQAFEVEIANGTMSAKGVRGTFSGSVDATGAANVTLFTRPFGAHQYDLAVSFSGNFTEHGLKVEGRSSTLYIDWRCFLTLARPAAPVLHPREEVEAYLADNLSDLRQKLKAYTRDNRVYVQHQSGYLWEVQKITSYNIVRLAQDRVFLEISYTAGPGARTRHKYGSTTFLFELQWIDGELEFVGHSKPGASPAGPAVAHSRAEVEAYLADNLSDLRLKLRAYGRDNRFFSARQSGYRWEIQRINSYKIVSLAQDRVFVEINYTAGPGVRPGSTLTSLFELQWIDSELEFVGHQKA